jgi:hypothetical protein
MYVLQPVSSCPHTNHHTGQDAFQNNSGPGDTFLQAWIGLWRKYYGAPFVSLMRILDPSLAKAATYLRKVDEPTIA